MWKKFLLFFLLTLLLASTAAASPRYTFSLTEPAYSEELRFEDDRIATSGNFSDKSQGQAQHQDRKKKVSFFHYRASIVLHKSYFWVCGLVQSNSR